MNYLFTFIFLLSYTFYGQNDVLAIIKHTENDLVIPKDAKIVFRGLKNEIYIDVPNAVSFEVEGIGIKKINKNTFSINPSYGTEVILNINGILKNGKKFSEKHKFEIRNVKRVISCFNHSKTDSILRLPKTSFKNGIVTVISPDKNLNLKLKVTRFSIKIPGKKAMVINSDRIDDKTYQEILKTSSNDDLITISDIKVSVLNLTVGCILVSPMVIDVY